MDEKTIIDFKLYFHLKSFTVPSNIERIGRFAFSGLVETITIPRTIIEIEDKAFTSTFFDNPKCSRRCPNLNKIIYKGTLEEWKNKFSNVDLTGINLVCRKRIKHIFLTEHKTYWADWYQEEIEYIKSILLFTAEYHHIGSTAINDIWAEPIIDILIVVKSDIELICTAEILLRNGYIIMSKNDKRISLNKGYTKTGFAEKVFHLHIRLENDVDEIYFRDYLNNHQNIAKEYEKLKLELWKKYEHNRDAYTQAKSEFIEKYTKLAKQISN